MGSPLKGHPKTSCSSFICSCAGSGWRDIPALDVAWDEDRRTILVILVFLSKKKFQENNLWKERSGSRS